MDVSSVFSRRIPRSAGALRAQRTGLITMGFFTGAWSMLAWFSGALGLRVAAGVLIVAAIYFLYRSTRVGSIELQAVLTSFRVPHAPSRQTRDSCSRSSPKRS